MKTCSAKRGSLAQGLALGRSPLRRGPFPVPGRQAQAGTERSWQQAELWDLRPRLRRGTCRPAWHCHSLFSRAQHPPGSKGGGRARPFQRACIPGASPPPAHALPVLPAPPRVELLNQVLPTRLTTTRGVLGVPGLPQTTVLTGDPAGAPKPHTTPCHLAAGQILPWGQGSAAMGDPSWGKTRGWLQLPLCAAPHGSEPAQPFRLLRTGIKSFPQLSVGL